MNDYSPVHVCVWGKYACFCRPEMKVERVSYEVITPSAARGILESIFWKPEFHWQIREIRVCKPVRYFSILRNEVTSRATVATARRRGEEGGYYSEEDRAQRHTLCLRDVAYIIAADVIVRPDVQEDEAKFRDQFQRRVKRGQCYTMPYLGCREFSANFGPEFSENLDTHTQDIDMKGRMLFDLDYQHDGSGRGQPIFFEAELKHGVLRIPETLYRREG